MEKVDTILILVSVGVLAVIGYYLIYKTTEDIKEEIVNEIRKLKGE